MHDLPKITTFQADDLNQSAKRLLIIAEGFEQRSLSFVKSLPEYSDIFQNVIICKYEPEKKTRLHELIAEINKRFAGSPIVVEFYRFNPSYFEQILNDLLKHIIIENIEEIVVDISVMSKLMIMIIIYLIKGYDKNVKIIYTEPLDYAPTEDEFLKEKDRYGKPTILPSYGVHDVVRTPLLSSVIMQRSPSLVITFTSFNEQLIRALLSSINPSRLILINGTPTVLTWREKATQDIHISIIKEFYEDNKIETESGLLEKRTSTLDYRETFKMLSDLYIHNCYLHRIVISPTGSKMQGLACALFKCCCNDVHVEYPTPESFFIKGYSSDSIRTIHQVSFDKFNLFLKMLSKNYELNG